MEQKQKSDASMLQGFLKRICIIFSGLIPARITFLFFEHVRVLLV